jgi:hypothetical protein
MARPAVLLVGASMNLENHDEKKNMYSGQKRLSGRSIAPFLRNPRG